MSHRLSAPTRPPESLLCSHSSQFERTRGLVARPPRCWKTPPSECCRLVVPVPWAPTPTTLRRRKTSSYSHRLASGRRLRQRRAWVRRRGGVRLRGRRWVLVGGEQAGARGAGRGRSVRHRGGWRRRLGARGGLERRFAGRGRRSRLRLPPRGRLVGAGRRALR